MTTRRTEERDVTYNEPYGRTEQQSAYASRLATKPGPAEGGTAMTTPAATAMTQGPVAPEVSTGRMSVADRISGGPIWSGFIIGIAVWIFLEIVLIAAGLNHIRAGQRTSVPRSDWWWSLGAGGVALFIGGLVSGLTSRWHTAAAGAVQGLTVWALSFVGLLLLAAVGAGIGFGAFSDAIDVRSTLNGTSVPASTISAARDAAGAAIVLLVVTAVVAVIGGIIGAMITGRTQRRTQKHARATGAPRAASAR
jgi:hypothetical protein